MLTRALLASTFDCVLTFFCSSAHDRLPSQAVLAPNHPERQVFNTFPLPLSRAGVSVRTRSYSLLSVDLCIPQGMEILGSFFLHGSHYVLGSSYHFEGLRNPIFDRSSCTIR
ncbi:hypothetical protein CPB84DRAFT_248507 [Gymnopilus junonius]|uniref:Secreted protein n=1 Tax=Gymnopilus junonius TaxID=109634 RepID=A0A9P5NVR3_GYMJU|nr:hypothetical protein CPB84DRAFT_248507 [Gymnopilus junonius]